MRRLSGGRYPGTTYVCLWGAPRPVHVVGRQSTASRSSVVPEFNLIAPLASTIVQTTEYLLLAPFHIQPTTTMRSLFVLALLVAAASAFVAPANQAVGTSDETPPDVVRHSGVVRPRRLHTSWLRGPCLDAKPLRLTVFPHHSQRSIGPPGS